MAQLPLPQPAVSWTSKWKATLDPIISAVSAYIIGNPLVAATYFPDVVLSSGANVIPIGLGHTPTGWFITDINAAATVYRSAAFSSSTLTLTASASCTVNLAVF